MPTVAPSVNDFVDIGKTEVASRRPDLSDHEDDVHVVALYAAASMADLCVRHSSQLFAETFMETSRGAALQRVVRSRTGLTPKPATKATGSVRITRPTALISETIPAGTEISTVADVSGKTISVTTDAAAAFALGNAGPVDVLVACTTTGREGNVEAGALTKLGGAFSSAFVVTNPDRLAGGNNVESDDDLIIRARKYPSTLTAAVSEAIEAAALGVDTVRNAILEEDPVNGFVYLYVADADGNSSRQMVAAVQEAVQAVRGAACVITTVGGVRLDLDLVIGIKPRKNAGYSVEAHQAELQAAIAIAVSKWSAGEGVYLDQINRAICDTAPDAIQRVDFESIAIGGNPVLPVADFTPPRNAVVRIGGCAIMELSA